MEKLRLGDNVGGGYDQKQLNYAYAYEQYKTYPYGKFGKEKEEDEYRFSDRHQQLMLHGNHRPLLKHNPAYELEKEEYHGLHQFHLMQHRPSPLPLKYGASPVMKEEEYHDRHQQQLMQHHPSLPPLKYRASVVVKEEEEYHERHQKHLMQHRLSPPPLKYRAPAIMEDHEGYRGRLQQHLMQHQARPVLQQPPLHHGDRLMAPQIAVRKVFVNLGQGGGTLAKSPEKKMKDATAVVGYQRLQHGGNMEGKWVRKGLD